MWIIMKKTHKLFLKGLRYDLPEDAAELIPTDCYEGCRAPWDEKKDTRAIALMVAEDKASGARLWAEQLTARAERAQKMARQLLVEAGAENVKAKKGKDTRKILVSEKLLAEARAVTLGAALLQLDAEDARRAADKAVRALERIKKAQAEVKAKA